MKLSELADKIPGIEVAHDAEFFSIGFINMVDLDKMIVFVKDYKFLSLIINNDHIAAVIIDKENYDILKKQTHNLGVVFSDNPEKTFYTIHNFLYKETNFYGVKEYETEIGENCKISEHAIVAKKNVTIGRNVIVEPGAVILENVKIGDNCVIGANSTIGTRGFQYYRDDSEAFYIEHVGGVVIEDNVEVLSNTCIASGLLRPTIIHEYVKIDNLVHIGHSAEVGRRTLITAGAVIGGSTIIGDRVWIGINSVLKAESIVSDDAFVCMGAVVTKDVEQGQKVSGNFAIDHKQQIRFIKELVNRESN